MTYEKTDDISGFYAIFSELDKQELARRCLALSRAAFGGDFSERDVSVLGTESLSAADQAAFDAGGAVCRMVCRGARRGETAALWVEPELIQLGASQAQPGLETVEFALEDGRRKSFCGADCYASALAFACANGPGVPVTGADNSMDPRPYYIRFSGDPGGWLAIVTRRRIGPGVITAPVSPKAAHGWQKQARRIDPTAFSASLFM